jgi:hypothetical protein
MNCQERDFCRRRLARRKRLKDDISAQRPEIGDHLARVSELKQIISTFVIVCGVFAAAIMVL